MKAMTRNLAATLFGFALLLFFQNCGQAITTGGDSSDSLQSSSQNPSSDADLGGGGTPTPQPTATPIVTGPACDKAQVGIPSMTALSGVTAQVLSGFGNGAGTARSGNSSFSFSSLTAPSNCNQGVNVTCALVSSNVTALDTSGVRSPIQGNDHTCISNQTTAGAAPFNFTLGFNAKDNDTNKQCFEGTATFDISLQSIADTSKNSPKQRMTVTYKNNCFPEFLKASAADAFDQLGTAVAIDGDVAAALAPGDDGDSNSISNLGAVYLYKKINGVWSLAQILRSEDTGVVTDRGSAGDSPASLALKGGVLAYGSELNNSNSGAVYVFKTSGTLWSQVAKLSGSVAGGRFGKAVAIDGEFLAIGAPGEATNAGAVYSYNIGNLTLQSKIAGPGIANNYFGASLALSGTTMAVGAPGATLFRDSVSGFVNLYGFSSGLWSEILTNPLRSAAAKTNVGGANIANGSELGASVSLGGGRLMAGAPGYSTAGGSPKKVGMVVVLSGAGFSTVQTLFEGAATELSRFGASVSIGAVAAYIGSPETRTRAGAVDRYVVSGTGFVLTRRIVSHTNALNDQFGFSVATSGNDFIVGAKLNAEPANSTGSVSLFSDVVP